MTTQTHKAHRHHCYNLNDLIPLIYQMGYHPSDKSYEDQRTATALSAEKQNHMNSCIIQLNKTTGELTVTT